MVFGSPPRCPEVAYTGSAAAPASSAAAPPTAPGNAAGKAPAKALPLKPIKAAAHQSP